MRSAGEVLQSVAELTGRVIEREEPRVADVILVLAGGRSCRSRHAFKLFRAGFAKRILISASTRWRIYERTEYDLAREFLSRQSAEVQDATELLAIEGDSTADEVIEVGARLDATGVHSILLVTSDFHSRRAFSVYKTAFPGRDIGVSGAADPTEFGERWWRKREWAKTLFEEMSRLIWWVAVDSGRVKHALKHASNKQRFDLLSQR